MGGVYTRSIRIGGRWEVLPITRWKSHATKILLVVRDRDVLSTIREQKYLLHHRSHCRYRYRSQSPRRVLAQRAKRLLQITAEDLTEKIKRRDNVGPPSALLA
jgi:hypothetical protein